MKFLIKTLAGLIFCMAAAHAVERPEASPTKPAPETLASVSLDTLLGIAGLVVGVIGVGVGGYGIRDGSRQRSRREVAVNAVNRLIGRTEGLLVGIKTSLPESSPAIVAVNNGLDAVKVAQSDVKAL